MASAGGKKVWTGRVMSWLPAPLFVMSAVFKFIDGPEVVKGFAHLGLPLSLRIPLAVLELSCLAIYLIPQSAVLGAILMTGYIGGAICTHLRVGDPFYLHIVLGI